MRVLNLEHVFDYPNPEYLIDQILYKNMLYLLSAYAGVGKTILTLSIAKSLITGEPLWGKFRVNHTGPVIILDEENPKSALKERIYKFGFRKSWPLYYIHYQGVKLDNPEHFKELSEIIADIQPVLVVFDSLIRFHHCEENDSTGMAKVMGKLRDLTQIGDPTIMAIHHDRKGSGDKMERVRGSGDIVGAVDVQLCLEAWKDGTRILSTGKTRMSPLVDIMLTLKSTEDILNFMYGGKV